MRRSTSGAYIDRYSKLEMKEKDLVGVFSTCQSSVHEALCGEEVREGAGERG